MTDIPTFAISGGFLGIARRDATAAVTIAGVPFDLGTTHRSGARFGPDAIRHASYMLVDGAHPISWTEPAKGDVSDIGNFVIALGDMAASFQLIERQAAVVPHLVTLGGDHGITLPLLRALTKHVGGPVGVVQFDSHMDTSPDNFGQPLAHGCGFYHAITEGLIDPKRMIQVGIRAPSDRANYDWTVGQGVTIVSAQAAQEMGPTAVAARIREVLGAGPSYLTMDIDALDPAFAPGTGTPEVGGLATWQLQSILRRLRGLDFRGMDVVEVAPAYDVSEITALAAATVVWEYLALLAPTPPPD
jgi:agmatinase